MARKAAIFIGVVVLGFVLFFGYRISRVWRMKTAAAEKARSLPVFSFTRLDGTPFTDDSLPNDGRRLIIMLFSPDCEHCQHTAKNFVRRVRSLGSCRLLLVTLADSLAAAQFYTDYRLELLPQLILLRDPGANFPRIFGVGVIPSFFVYKDRRLVNKFIGESRLDNLLSDLPLHSEP